MAAISCDGEVGDGAEVAAGEAIGGFAEGGVGLDAERNGCFAMRHLRSRICLHDDGFATHGIVLLPAAVLANAAVRISSSAAMAVSTCAALEDEGWKEAEDGFAGAIDDDAAGHQWREHLLGEISGIELEASMRPMPRTSTMQSWRGGELGELLRESSRRRSWI